MSSYDGTLKILLLSDPEVDKSGMFSGYLTYKPQLDDQKTIGVEFIVKTLVIDKKKYKLQLWDILWDIGQEDRFRFLLPTYCLGTNAAVLLYDVTRSQTLDNIGEWVNIVRQKSGDIPIILVGVLPNKKNERQVSAEEGKKIAKSRNINQYIECGVRQGDNVEKIFEALTRLILANNDYHTPSKKAEDLSLHCYKCNLQLTKEEFLNHPCFTTGAVNLRGAINGGFNYLTTKERRKKEKRKKKRAKKERKIGERRKKEEAKDEEYIITYTRHLERRLRNLETEKQLLDAERLRLEQEVNSLRNELDRYKSPKDKIYCQYCGRKLTEEEQFTHSCEKKPSSPRARRQRSPTTTVGDKIDPKLKGEVQSFLEWIKDSEGLSGYINYYLQQNNTSIISELSKIYTELRQILFESTQTKGEDRNKILSNLSIPSRSEILHEISQNIFEQNRIITEHGVPEEIVSDLKSKKKEISREELLIDNLISNIQKNPSKKVIYLRLFLDRFRDLSDQDKNVIIKSIEDEADDNNDDDDRFPYPYIFTHPKPPDDFEPAPQSQIRTPSKEKDCEDEYYCQYCGRKLTKEEQFTHSCNRFYLG